MHLGNPGAPSAEPAPTAAERAATDEARRDLQCLEFWARSIRSRFDRHHPTAASELAPPLAEIARLRRWLEDPDAR